MKKINRRKISEFFKVFSHPVRLMIIEELLDDKKCVTEIKELLNARQPNISQHLLVLRMSGIVDYDQSGKMKCYFLRNPKLVKKVLKAVESTGSLKPVLGSFK
ncbi:MAG: metalloregulator ArsR/SmtB family transcription factor [Elusimicrobiota bacterium]|nr:metalloregulator ArsR/SmtB family transcription factor [Elusimicrobiota bacterium]